MPEKNDEVKFTLKLHPELAAKLNYIAEGARAARKLFGHCGSMWWNLRRNLGKSPRKSTREFE